MGSGKEKLWRFEIDENRKQEGLKKISSAVQEKKVRYYPSFLSCLTEQLRYQTWSFWAMQGSLLMLAFVLIRYLNKAGSEEGFFITVCSVFMVLTGNVCLSGTGRLFSWHMAELEQTLYLNLKQMVSIQMLLAGIMDLLVLSLFVIFCGGRYDTGTAAYLLYMLVPFLWSDILYLHMLTALRGGMRGYRQLSVGLISAVLAVSPVLLEDSYRPEYLTVWGIIAAIGIGVLIFEVRRLLGKIEGGEGLCLN